MVPSSDLMSDEMDEFFGPGDRFLSRSMTLSQKPVEPSASPCVPKEAEEIIYSIPESSNQNSDLDNIPVSSDPLTSQQDEDNTDLHEKIVLVVVSHHWPISIPPIDVVLFRADTFKHIIHALSFLHGVSDGEISLFYNDIRLSPFSTPLSLGIGKNDSIVNVPTKMQVTYLESHCSLPPEPLEGAPAATGLKVVVRFNDGNRKPVQMSLDSIVFDLKEVCRSLFNLQEPFHLVFDGMNLHLETKLGDVLEDEDLVDVVLEHP